MCHVSDKRCSSRCRESTVFSGYSAGQVSLTLYEDRIYCSAQPRVNISVGTLTLRDLNEALYFRLC
jgi:hypothetical protein